jgi:hypothetical protein
MNCATQKLLPYASKMPITILSWNNPTSAPRRVAGAISARYTGASTEDPPMATPVRKRQTTNDEKVHAIALPSAEITYSNPTTRNMSRLP